MKNVKTILIIVGAIAFLGSLFAFTQRFKKVGDEKCHIKIVKIVDGVETVIDSTFDCPDDMTWVESFEEEMGGDSIHKMIKIMMLDDDSGSFSFDFNFDSDENDGHEMKVIKFISDDGEETEMNFDFKDMEWNDGKMTINGKEIEMAMDELHQHLGEMGNHMMGVSDEMEMIFETKEDGEEPHVIKITKEVDEEGNVTMKKVVDGKEVEIDEEEMEKMHKQHKMMFISDGEDGVETKEISINVEVNDDGETETKHMVFISKITTDNSEDIAKKIPNAKKNLNKEELSVNKLKFSPNPNDGKFNLNFKLDKNDPVLIQIYDMQGKEVYKEQINNFSGKYNKNIDISERGEGIYIMQIIQNQKASTHKIAIK